MTDPSPPRFAVGYALAPKKQHSFIQPSLLSLAAARGIDLLPIDPSLPIAPQGGFSLILHKLYSDEWQENLRCFSLLHPDVPIIDPPAAVQRLHNRISMLQFASDLQITLPPGSPTFSTPRQVVASAPADLHSTGLNFPVIAKPLVADGSAKSHNMALVFQPDALLKLKPPVVLQEFINHGGVIFKVYVVGDYVKCVKRKSLPDVSKEELEGTARSLSFSQVSNMTTPDKTVQEYYATMHLEDAEMPPQAFVTEIARGLRRAMGLHLFNFDMIRDADAANQSHYFVIDINYFPGYAKMPNYEAVMTDFFWSIVNGGGDEVPPHTAGEEVQVPRGGNGDAGAVEEKM